MQRSFGIRCIRRVLLLFFIVPSLLVHAADPALRDEAIAAMKRAATFYRERVATHGGYVYHYSLDLQQRWGEGQATEDQIWVQPPGTPTVGMAYLAAYKATRDPIYLQVATEAATALIHGQLESGCWTQVVDFDPQGSRVAQYRNKKGRGRNYSTLDDGQTQSAIQFLSRADEAHQFKHAAIHESVRIAIDSLLNAQFPNGAFPQVWDGPVAAQPIVKATFPDYDWRTENRIKEYWDLYTLNDDLAGDVSDTLLDAWRIYKQERLKDAVVRLGDFLLLAQLPEPQPAWSQQYDYQMRPVWARKFEPPAVSGRESQDVLETLLKVYRLTGDKKYLAPFPSALAYLKRSLLPDGQLARYYELRSNKPLYMTEDYQLTYDDSDVPSHYGWKGAARIEAIERAYQAALQGEAPPAAMAATGLEARVRQIIQDLDDQGRWISTHDGQMLVGQPKIKAGEKYISSAVFSQNLETLSAYVNAK